MDVILKNIATLAFLASVAETALYLLYSRWYYRLGPAIFHDEWQSRVPVARAREAFEDACEGSVLSARPRGDLLCVRARNWDWGVLPRITLRLQAMPQGAVFICEARPYFGVALLTIAVATFLALDTHYLLAAMVALFGSLLCRGVWRRDARRFSRLSPLHPSLRLIGLRVCRHCGYDLTGIDDRRPCPECGRHANKQFAVIPPQQVRMRLEQRAEDRRLLNYLGLSAGSPLLLIGPLFFSMIVWFFAHQIIRVTLPFGLTFILTSLVTIPLLLLLELSTRADYFSQSLHLIADRFPGFIPLLTPPRFGLTSLGEHGWGAFLMNPFGVAAFFTEIFLAGPRMVLGAAARLRHARQLAAVDPARAADVIVTLLSKQSGMRLEELLRPGEKLADLVPVIGWLASFEWIGVADKADRVFLYSETRDLLLDED